MAGRLRTWDDISPPLEVALQETNSQRQQIAANIEQGKQQMQQIMQPPQNKPQ